MLKAANPRFLSPADNARPYKSHRYDVFGLKVDRMMTLYGLTPLHTWIRMEADPDVQTYCERPHVIADSKPKRVVEFWVGFRDREELWLSPRRDELERKLSPSEAEPAFCAWAAHEGITVRFISDMVPVDGMYVENWGRIIRELSANRRFVAAPLKDRILGCITTARPLSALAGLFPEEDPVLLRTAAFSLLHVGKLRCPDIGMVSPEVVYEM